MKGFIEITNNYRTEEIREIIPLSKIDSIETYNTFCTIYLTDGTYRLPDETYEEIKELIKDASN